MSGCGCQCVCHGDEQESWWPGPCAACCDHELTEFTCACVEFQRGLRETPRLIPQIVDDWLVRRWLGLD